MRHQVNQVNAQSKSKLANTDLARAVAWGVLALYVVTLLIAQQFVESVFVVSQSERSQIISQQFRGDDHLLLSLQDIANKKTSAEVVSGLKDLYLSLGLTFPQLEVVELSDNGDFMIKEVHKNSRTSF